MSVRMRHTSAHTKNRRSHHAISAASTMVDKESGALRQPHRLDESTGTYRGNLIAAPKVKKERAKAEKYEHPEHTHNEQIEAEPEETKKPEVDEKHETEENPKARSNA